MRMPGIVMENLEFDREISGDRWIVRLPFAEKRGEQAIVRSIDIRRRMGSGGEWYFFGTQGVLLLPQPSEQRRGLTSWTP